MPIFDQLKLALFNSPPSLLLMKQRSFRWCVLYALLTTVVFGVFVYLMLINQDLLKNMLLDYLFPRSWHSVSERLVSFLFESQTKIVLSNLILSGSLVLASITLFPIKEKYSAQFEQDANYANGAIQEFSLRLQAWEEAKLFLIYLTAQSVILWIGYYPYQWSISLSIILSYLFLFFTFGLDIISPTLQRHRISYSLILKFFLKRPLLVLSFGLVYSLPLIAISHFVFKLSELSFIEMTAILFLSNIVFLTLAVPAGTHLASHIIEEIRATAPPSAAVVKKTYFALALLLLASLFLHSQLVIALHHKSQLLKAQYELDWSSLHVDVPTFSQLLDGNALSNFSIDVVITNPTKFDIIIETSEIVVKQHQILIATLDLNGFSLGAGQKKRINLTLTSDTNLSLISDLSKILKGWRIDLYIDIWPGIPFVINVFSSAIDVDINHNNFIGSTRLSKH